MDKCPRPCYDGVLITKCEVTIETGEEDREFGPCPMCNENDARGLVGKARERWRIAYAERRGIVLH